VAVSTGIARAALMACLAIPLQNARAADPLDVPVILPLTGSGAFGGNGFKNDLVAAQDSINAKTPVLRLQFHDDQTNPQQAVQVMAQIAPSHPLVVLGSSIVASCNAIAPFTTAAGPVLFCMSPSFNPKPGSFGFVTGVPTGVQIGTLLTYLRAKGLTRIASLNTTDATGQNGDHDLQTALADPQGNGITLVAQTHFNPTDLTVTAQLEQIRASGAQAVFAWTTGTPLATVFKGMTQTGLDIPVATTAGNQTFEEMAAFSSFLPNHLLIASALFPPHDGLLSLDPRVEAEQHRMYAALTARGLKPDVSAEAWDAGLIVAAALQKLGADATPETMRKFVAGLTDFPGANGIYNFVAHPQRGLGPDSATVVTYDRAQPSWTWLSQPGGEPLGR
jgi:branched-chain amino acid transport system substrate-binding protein